MQGHSFKQETGAVSRASFAAFYVMRGDDLKVYRILPVVRNALGGDIDGMLAEEVTLPEDALVKIPEQLGFIEVFTLPCAAVTAWNAIFVSSATRPGGGCERGTGSGRPKRRLQTNAVASWSSGSRSRLTTCTEKSWCQ